MDLALFVLRAVVGLLLVGHGAQKLFGSFGGHGLAGTGQFFEGLGLTPGRRNAMAAGLGEFAGGLLLVVGLFTPFAAAAIIGVMVVAILTVHAPKGPWATDGGYEYNAVLIAVAFALAGAGPGAFSLDNAFGLNLAGTGWALGALAAGILGGIAALLSARGAAAPVAGAPPTAPQVEAEPRFERGERIRQRVDPPRMR
jgi:putative oxidoreductase